MTSLTPKHHPLRSAPQFATARKATTFLCGSQRLQRSTSLHPSTSIARTALVPGSRPLDRIFSRSHSFPCKATRCTHGGSTLPLNPGSYQDSFKILHHSRAQSQRVQCTPDIGGPAAAENVLRVHYLRKDKKYEGWGLHVWGDVQVETAWTRAMEPTGTLNGGVFFDVPLQSSKGNVGLLVHRGDEKAAGGMVYKVTSEGGRWLYDSEVVLLEEAPDLDNMPVGNLLKSYCHWVDARSLVWRVSPTDDKGETHSFQLHFKKDAGLKLDGGGIQGADKVIPLEFSSKQLEARAVSKFPHLQGCVTLKLPEEYADVVPELVTGQLAVSMSGSDGTIQDNTGVQIAGLLDELFFYDGQLGDVINPESKGHELRVWAPTAHNVEVLHWKEMRGGEPSVHPMTPQSNGVWSFPRPAEWTGQCYKYRVTAYCPWNTQMEVMETTDPYSRCTTANGERSIMVDLQHPELLPAGWNEHTAPHLASWTDVSVYELHIRDFSSNDATVPAALKGKYLAFSPEHVTAGGGALSNGLKHLQRLQAAGLNHIHLLPTYDYGSVPERVEEQLEVQEDLSKYAPDSEVPQSIIASICDQDAFNWGYDPVHYGVPEGSYSTNPDGTARVVEFRHMVKSLHDMGFRVVLDVVYNHTFRSGPTDALSVLDKVVPGYYHRRGEDGSLMNSTCCNNTASEHRMCEKFFVDDAVHWAKTYKIPAWTPPAADVSHSHAPSTASRSPSLVCAASSTFKHSQHTSHCGILPHPRPSATPFVSSNSNFADGASHHGVPCRATPFVSNNIKLGNARRAFANRAYGVNTTDSGNGTCDVMFRTGFTSVYSAKIRGVTSGWTPVADRHSLRYPQSHNKGRVHQVRNGGALRQWCITEEVYRTCSRQSVYRSVVAKVTSSSSDGSTPSSDSDAAKNQGGQITPASSSGPHPAKSQGGQGRLNERVSREDSKQAIEGQLHEQPISGPSSEVASSADRSTPAVKTGVWRVLDDWNKRTTELNDKLRSLGIAGIVAYGMLNTVYYTLAFLFFWIYVVKVPSGMGIGVAASRCLEVFGLVWAGSQVTKLARAAGAVVLAPIADAVLGNVMEQLRLKSKQQAFLVLVGGCIVGACGVFGLTVMAYA